jgi:hypothetical protein
MNGKCGFHLLAGAAVLAAAMVSSMASAAEGASCVLRVAGPQGVSGGTLGHMNADGKCVSKDSPKAAKESSGDGLEASAQCKDLTFSYAKRRESACIKHGGVLEWLAQG